MHTLLDDKHFSHENKGTVNSFFRNVVEQLWRLHHHGQKSQSHNKKKSIKIDKHEEFFTQRRSFSDLAGVIHSLINDKQNPW